MYKQKNVFNISVFTLLCFSASAKCMYFTLVLNYVQSSFGYLSLVVYV